MPHEMTLTLEERPGRGQNASRRLRREGRLPAVVYGDGIEPMPVSVATNGLQKLIRSDRGLSTLLNLEFEDSSKNCKALVKDLQIEPVQEGLLHVDFLRVSMDKEIHVNIQIEFIGTPIGVKTEGGLLHIRRHDLEIACLPGDIPESLPLDVSELSIGQELRVDDITLPDGITAVTEGSRLVVHVVPPTLVKTEDTDEEAEEGLEEAGEAAPEESTEE